MACLTCRGTGESPCACSSCGADLSESEREDCLHDRPALCRGCADRLLCYGCGLEPAIAQVGEHGFGSRCLDGMREAGAAPLRCSSVPRRLGRLCSSRCGDGQLVAMRLLSGDRFKHTELESGEVEMRVLAEDA